MTPSFIIVMSILGMVAVALGIVLTSTPILVLAAICQAVAVLGVLINTK